MPNTYTQLYAHIIFVVKGRSNLISNKWKDELYKYITGVISNKNQKLMVINGMSDHLHLLVGFKPDCLLSDLVRDIKSSSSKWINEKRFVAGKFEWQSGFGAFTVAQSQIEKVVEYIKKQEEHHRRKTFREEYVQLLEAYKVEYEAKYIFEDYGDSRNEETKSTV